MVTVFSDWFKAELQQHGGSDNMVVLLASFRQLEHPFAFRAEAEKSPDGCYRNSIRWRGAVALFVHTRAPLYRRSERPL